LLKEKKPEKIPVKKHRKLKLLLITKKSIREAFSIWIKSNIKCIRPQLRIVVFKDKSFLNGDKAGSSNKISTLEKDFYQLLNTLFRNTSASNRNNTRTDLSALVQTVNNELMNDNHVKSINVLKSAPEKTLFSNTRKGHSEYRTE
jgi:hypothetical protein